MAINKSTGRLLDRDGRSLKERLVDFAKGSDNFSRMGTENPGVRKRKTPIRKNKLKPPKKGGKPKRITTKNKPGGPETPGAKEKRKKNKK